MMRKIILFIALVFGLSTSAFSSDFKEINEFVSPEYLCLSKDKSTVYIGLSTYSGIAVFDIRSESIQKIISMPTPVSGIVLDETKGILYAGSRANKSQIYVYDLKAGKTLKQIEVGHGPEELAVSVRNKLFFSSNKFTNDVSVISLENQSELARIDVSREPVALAVSPNEKTLAVANLLPEQSAMSSFIAAKISLVDIQTKKLEKEIDLPNGSFALKDLVYSKDGKYIYASHLIGRFNVLTNQIEKGWINTNAISIIEIKTQKLYTSVLLDDIYKGASNPCGLNISEDGSQLFAAISGTHELFVIDRAGMHEKIAESKENSKISQSALQVSEEKEEVKVFQEFSEIKQMTILFEDISKELGFLASVRKRIKLNGKGPARIVSAGNKVFVSSYFSDGLEVVDLSSAELSSKLISIGNKDISTSQARFGELLFNDAEHCFQQWQSCASCHPGNGRVDGLNWDLLNDGIGNPKNTKNLLYSHVTPPTMISGIRKDGETCVRAGFKYIQFFDAPEENAQAVDSYLKSLRPVPSPYLINGKLSESAKKGKQVFEELNCTLCHSGAYFTNMQSYEMGEKGKYDKQNKWDTPTLIEVWRTAPYLHNGEYSDLKDIFQKGKHGIKTPLSGSDLKNITEYILSL